jgi:hypothetical protein
MMIMNPRANEYEDIDNDDNESQSERV